MALASQQVVNRIVAILAAAGTSAGSRWTSDRFHPLSAYPSGRVLADDEDLAADDDGDTFTWPLLRLHRLTVDVEVHVEAAAALDAAMSAVALEVLQALEGDSDDSMLLPLVGCRLRATGIRRRYQENGSAVHGVATVNFEVLFRTYSNAPQTLV